MGNNIHHVLQFILAQQVYLRWHVHLYKSRGGFVQYFITWKESQAVNLLKIESPVFTFVGVLRHLSFCLKSRRESSCAHRSGNCLRESMGSK